MQNKFATKYSMDNAECTVKPLNVFYKKESYAKLPVQSIQICTSDFGNKPVGCLIMTNTLHLNLTETLIYQRILPFCKKSLGFAVSPGTITCLLEKMVSKGYLL